MSGQHEWTKTWYTVAYALRQGWLWILAGVLVLLLVSLGYAWVQCDPSQGLGKHIRDERQATLNRRLGCPTHEPCQGGRAPTPPAS